MGTEALRLAAELVPNGMLMDINLPRMSGLEATRRIVAAAPSTVVVLLSTYRNRDLPEKAATRGELRPVHKEHFGPEVLADDWAQRKPAAGGGS